MPAGRAEAAGKREAMDGDAIGETTDGLRSAVRNCGDFFFDWEIEDW